MVSFHWLGSVHFRTVIDTWFMCTQVYVLRFSCPINHAKGHILDPTDKLTIEYKRDSSATSVVSFYDVLEGNG
jgi:hypothetical protein